jgi:hypothetical protein
VRTYSSVLGDEDCRTIDRRAYAAARTWFTDGSSDPTRFDGVSLGRAWELRATAVLVLSLRAEQVLRRLCEDTGATAVDLRSVGGEWRDAARRLGLDVAGASGSVADPALAIPDVGRRRPRAANRLIGSIGGRRTVDSDGILVIELARWGRAHQRALTRRWPVRAVNPYGSMLLDAVFRGRPIPAQFLGDEPLVPAPLNADAIAVPADLPRDILRRGFALDAPAMAASARLGLRIGGAVAVTGQDVSPTVRAFLLGFRGGGGRVVTLEHGISGWYAEQVHTVADVLAAWGPRQAEYHRAAGPPDAVVEPVGWPRLSEAVAERVGRHPPRWDAVFFGQPTLPLSAGSWPEDRLAGHAALDAYARRRPSRRVGVKAHPAAWAYRSPTPDPAAARPATGDSLDLVRAARVVVRSTSTTGLEAMALGRPVVTIASRGPLGGPDFLAEGGAAVTVGDEHELEEALERLLGDPREYARRVEAGRAFAGRFVGGLDDPSAAPRRLVEIVDRLQRRDSAG